MGKIKWKPGVKRVLLAVTAGLFAGGLAFAAPFGKAEYWLGDSLFIQDKAVDNRIKIIGIDSASLQEMGPFAGWSRQQAADLLNALDKDYAPAVIAFDINYFGERDQEGDRALAEAAAGFGQVVMASYLQYTTRLEEQTDGSMWMNPMYLEQVEQPYEALAAVSRQGFTNAVQDEDNYVRRAILSEEWNGRVSYNFAYETYCSYMEAVAGEPVVPETDGQGVYGFDYTAEPGMYEVYSYGDVVAGRCDVRVFRDSIVLVGAYASAMMDQYMVPIARGAVMNGVEVQANHVNALLEERTFREMSRWLCGALAMVIVGGYVYLVSRSFLMPSMIAGACAAAVVVFGAKLLYGYGVYWKCLTPVIGVFIVALVRVVAGYLAERLRKRKILNVFRTYMAPQVVDELSRNKNYQIELGVRDREIAVLFVDIRGFTALSERLSPKEMVEILNRYLGQVTEAIFRNEGTLDKFIGDAVMAVYNAPLDVEDYWSKAVRTGIDIVAAVRRMNRELIRDFQLEIACGVGIHCGRAVVGNIGCTYRMDYTAIGDTVNVAERLESIAKGGQVLLSEEMYLHVKENFHAEFMGKQSLKGRVDGINVFSLEVADGTDADR
jgi:adenylate cyclase